LWLTNWARYVQALALEIRGEKFVLEGWWQNIASKQQGHVMVFFIGEIPY
jgi:hypothetical protein